jgi:glycosyltransferase involved in cell wall biosynthesis
MMPLDTQFDDLGARGIKTASLGMRQGVPDPRALLALARLLRKWRPDVLHGHMVHANLLARLSRFLVWTPVVISTMHSDNEGAQWRYYAYRLTDRLSTITTTVSDSARDEALRRHAAPGHKIIYIPNGVDVGAYRSDDDERRLTRDALGIEGEFLWLAAGRLAEPKDYPTMLRAFAQLRTTRPDSRLLIAGAGPLEELLQSLAESLGLGDHVRFLGLRSDVPALLRAADGFVMSSAWEGLPVVLLEAGASSLPIVATDVSGTRDVVVDGDSGTIVAAGDPEALAEAMKGIEVLSDSDRREMGAAGRAHVEAHFDAETVADRWESLYRRLLGTSDGPSR